MAAVPGLQRRIGTWQVALAGASYVIAATTLVGDLSAWFALGAGFVVPLLAAFAVNVLLALSVAELSASFPRCGAIYEFAKACLRGGRLARFAGVWLALTLIGLTALAGAGEIAAGAWSLKVLLGGHFHVRWYVVALMLAALIPNLLGWKQVAGVTLVALVLMVGLRWALGIVGFSSPTWSVANLAVSGDPSHAFATGLGLAFWSFVGVEAVAPFAEELEQGPRSLAVGMVAAQLLVLLTTLVMGLGAAGARSALEWRGELAALGCGGDCPHLAAGQALMGEWGVKAMAAAAVMSCYGTVVIGLAALTRVLLALGRDEGLFGGASGAFARVATGGVPSRTALVCVTALLTVPPLFSQQVLLWLLSAALLWVVLYLVYHALLLADRWRAPGRARAFRVPLVVPLSGACLTLGAIPILFRDSDGRGLAWRALGVLGVAGLVSLGLATRSRRASPPSPAGDER